MRVLNVCGVVRESFKVMCSRAKLFAAIALTLTLPLCFIVLAHNLAIHPLADRVRQDTQDAQAHKHLTAERIKLGFLLAAYVLFALLFALLSTSAIVYTVACIYTKRALTYPKVLRVVPRVWRRLLVTFLVAFLFVFFITAAFLAVFLFIFIVFYRLSSVVAMVFWWIAALYFFAVLFHFSCLFNLSCVITVLEESYGLGALRKSIQLIKGRRLVTYILYATYLVLSAVVVLSFDVLAGIGHLALQIFFAILFALLLSFVDLLGTMVFTILYFTCKAYHHESIDMLVLSEHLGAYMGEYVNLRASVQMESMQRT